jgi:pilus assembly protein Flp/PilA
MRELWNNFVKDESGQGLTEYILIIALIAVGLILVLGAFRGELGRIFNLAGDELEQAGPDQVTPTFGTPAN